MAATTQQLTEAQAAYHKLLTGTSVVKVRDSNGEEITYGIASASRLAAYIESLKLELGLIVAGRGPMQAWF